MISEAPGFTSAREIGDELAGPRHAVEHVVGNHQVRLAALVREPAHHGVIEQPDDHLGGVGQAGMRRWFDSQQPTETAVRSFSSRAPSLQPTSSTSESAPARPRRITSSAKARS